MPCPQESHLEELSIAFNRGLIRYSPKSLESICEPLSPSFGFAVCHGDDGEDTEAQNDESCRLVIIASDGDKII